MLDLRARFDHFATRMGLNDAERRVLLRVPETAALLSVLAISFVVRSIELGSVPRIIAGDELDNLGSAYSVIEGTGEGIFGFDWKGTPLLGLYPLAGAVRVFGNSVADFRMYTVILSLLTILLFYALARESMSALAALMASLLLGTNLWFLHFSRTAWDNIVPSVAAVGACWAATRALKNGCRWWLWWAACGLFLAGGLYSYYSGRMVPLAIPLVCALALALRQAPWHRVAIGLGIAGVVTVLLFAPMISPTVHRWDEFSRRANDVSVFRNASFLDRGPWETVRNNLGRNYRGFILQDGSEMTRGLWARYGPAGRAPLEIVGTHIFWAGLVIAAVRWRRTYTWWPFFVPLFATQLFSRGTPDLARSVFFAPFYFLFIGIALDEALRRSSRAIYTTVIVIVLAGGVAFIAVSDVQSYFAWQRRDETQVVRMTGIDRCEFDDWQRLARNAAAANESFPLGAFEKLYPSPSCSPLVQRTRVTPP